MLSTLLVPYSHGSSNYRTFVILGLSQLALFLVLWSIFPIKGLSNPLAIVTAFQDLISDRNLFGELSISVILIVKAIFWSTLISLSIVWASTALIFRPFASLTSSFRFLGFAGITFLFTLWTSSGAELKLWMLTFGMTVFLTTSMLAEIKSIPKSQIDYARTLGLSGWQITWEVAVLSKLDVLLDNVRQNAAIGWTILSMVEGIFRSEGGIGTLLLNQNKYFHLDAVFAIQIVILAYGIAQDRAFVLARSFLFPYSNLTKE